MKLAGIVAADMSAITTPPSSRKYLDDLNDDESTACTVQSEESQSVISLQNAVIAHQKEQQPSPFDRFRSRIASSFMSSPTAGKEERTEEEQAEHLHRTRLRILLKNPEMFREFQKRTRETGCVTPTGVRLALHQFLKDMRVAELLEDLQCEHPDEDPESERESSTRRSFFSPFGIYTYSRAQSLAVPPLPRLGPRVTSGGRKGYHDDASVLTFDESLAMPSLAGCDDDEDGDNEDGDDDDEGFGSDGDHNDNDCSSVGSRSLATTFSGVSSLSSQPRSFSRSGPDSWRSMGSKSSSLRFAIQEDENFP